MRILFVANTLPPHDLSGVGEQVLQLAAGLRAKGCEVHLLGRGPGGARGPKVLFPLTVVPALGRVLKSLRPDVVQVHESDGGLAALAVRALRGRRARPRLVALQQVSYVEERRAVRTLAFAGRVLGRPGAVERRFRWLKAPWQILLGKLSARLADLVLAPSQATARELVRDYGVRRVGVLPNVTGGLEIQPEALPGAAGAEGYLLFVGRLRIRKGVEVALEALARLRAEGRPIRLLLAGEGEHRSALEQRMVALGLEREVRFLGRASAGQVRALLGHAAALVVPSIYEGMPLVVLEAMAAGVPVITSRVSGMPEVVVDGQTGWLVPPEDPVALASSIAHAWGDPAERARRGAAGQRRCAELYTPAGAAETWLAAIESVPGRSS